MRKVVSGIGMMMLVLILVTSAVSEDFNVDDYTWEQLISIREVIDARIAEYEAEDARINGNRHIALPDEDIIVYIGQPYTMKATVEQRTADAPKKTTLVWSSSDPTIATVGPNGQVKGLTVGDVEITASAKDDQNIQRKKTIHVAASVSTLTISDTELYLLLGEEEDASKYQLQTVVTPEEAHDKTVSWTSSDETVATVDDNGNVQAISAGKATITVTTNDTSLKKPKVCECIVTVNQAVESLTLNTTSAKVVVGGSYTLDASVLPDIATQKMLVWESSDPDVATVSRNGLVKGIAGGKCEITCKTTDGTDISSSCIISVIQQVSKIELVGYKKNSVVNLIENENKKILFHVLPESASEKNLRWSSSDQKVASIEESTDLKIVIKAGKAGSCMITGHALDGSDKKIDIKVSVENRFSVEPTGYGNWGTKSGIHWFTTQYINKSASRTVDSITIRYYATDVYGNKLKAYGVGNDEKEDTISITIAPGKKKYIPRIMAYGYKDAKEIYIAIVKVYYTDGTSYNIDSPDYFYCGFE